MKDAVGFPTLLETFFTRRLIAQRKASPHTIASYRDTFRLLLQFAKKQLAKAPSGLTMEDLNAPFLGAFLDHLESTRTNGARSRNLRLTAIRSFFRFAALETPQHSGLIQRVLVIPNKRQPRPLVGFLTRPEIDALLATPDRNTWLGRRDHALILTALQTGLRLTEITSIRQQDVKLRETTLSICLHVCTAEDVELRLELGNGERPRTLKSYNHRHSRTWGNYGISARNR